MVACTSAQRRDNARKRATEVLAWKAVIGQLDPDDDKRAEALAEHRSAADRVDSDLLKAFQHFAYLTRTDRVEVDWQRFDDDTKSSLKGSHVWDALAGNGRAVFPGRLSGEYLRTLLAKVPRSLTLKETGQQFYKNAAFPLVPSSEDIRRAIFQTLIGPDPYEVVDGVGEVLAISSLDELSIGSMELSLRKKADRPGPGVPEDEREQPAAYPDGPAPEPDSDTARPPEPPPQGPDYRQYRLDVPNRSLVDHDARRSLANLLQAVLDAVDPDTGGDVQLFDLQLSLTADRMAVEDIGERAADIGATWSAEELDF